jgi:hypothetical protein
MANIAPVPNFTERTVTAFDGKAGRNPPGNRGPLTHEEGIATDTDVPNDFARGAFYDTAAVAGTISDVNPESIRKHADETTHERAHLGSAAWAEAPEQLQDFVMGASSGQQPPSFERVQNSGAIIRRRPITLVTD